jgi:hypothetical protein
MEGLKRAGIGPPASEDLVGHDPGFDVVVVDVGDLQLAAL